MGGRCAAVLAEARAQKRLPIFVGGSGPLFQGADARAVGGAADSAGDPRRRSRAAGTRRRRGAARRTGATRSCFRRAAEAARPHPHRARARSGRGDGPLADRLASRWLAAAACRREHSARVFLAPDRDQLYARIDARFDAMLNAGALEEVAALGGAASRSAAAGDEGPWRAGADPASARRNHAGGGGRRSAAPTPAITPSGSSPGFGINCRNSNGWSRSGAGWLAAAMQPRERSRRISPSPNAGNPANLVEIACSCRLPLTFGGLDAMVAQPLGSPSRQMRNIITKLLIVVVPRRTAGDG